MASSSISLTPDEDVDTTCLNDLISRVTNDDITPDQFISFDDHVETSNTETDIARTVASRSTVDDEEGELGIPEVYNEDVKNSVKSHQKALSMIQQLEEFSKKKECTTSLQDLWMVRQTEFFCPVSSHSQQQRGSTKEIEAAGSDQLFKVICDSNNDEYRSPDSSSAGEEG
jgi:hypothetical protein